VRNLIEKSSQPASSGSEPKLPLVRIKVTISERKSSAQNNEEYIIGSSHFVLQVDYSGFSTINPQRFGQKYVGKVPPALMY
jgi:double-strand break repair protein MRE11